MTRRRSLAAIGVTPEQAMADNNALPRLIRERQPTPEARAQLEQIHSRYAQARSPHNLGLDHETLAYHMRLFSLDRWHLWRRLTLYRDWRGPHGERMDRTNNATERWIGRRIKERHRTMRGYKRKDSVLPYVLIFVPSGCAHARRNRSSQLPCRMAAMSTRV